MKWFRKAAEHSLPAQNNLGLLYAKGQGGPQDYAEAVKWYRKAAEQGLAAGQFNLGDMYRVRSRGAPGLCRGREGFVRPRTGSLTPNFPRRYVRHGPRCGRRTTPRA